MDRFALAIVFAAWIAASVEALSPDSQALEIQPSPVVTEEDFLSVLDRLHPAAVEASQALAVARAEVVGASTLENPSFGVSREDPQGPALETEWSLSWQIPSSSRRLDIRSRQEAVEAAQARLFQRMWSLRLEMKEVYAEWAIATVRRDRILAHAQRLRFLAKRERSRADQGEASGLAARRLDLAAARLEAQAALADGAVERAQGRAAAWHPELPGDGEPVLPALPEAAAFEDEHPLLRAAQADLNQAILEQKASGRFVASPQVTLGWKRQEEATESVSGPVVGVGWSIPLFARNQGEKAAAAASVSAARARLELLRRTLSAEQDAALAAYRVLAEGQAEADASVAGAAGLLTGAEAAFLQGEDTLTDLLDTLALVAEAESTALDLRQAALAAHREVQRLSPGSGAPDLVRGSSIGPSSSSASSVPQAPSVSQEIVQ